MSSIGLNMPIARSTLDWQPTLRLPRTALLAALLLAGAAQAADVDGKRIIAADRNPVTG